MEVTPQADKTIRISFSWVMLGIVIVIALGFLGSVLAQQVLPVNSTTAPDGANPNRFLTTIQEVTISPNQSAAAIVEKWQRSVFLLAATGANPATSSAITGFLITNDGVIVTAGTLAGSSVVAYDSQGSAIPVDFIGTDSLFNLSYYRLTTGVFSPLDFSQTDPALAYQLVAMSRSGTTFQPQVGSFWLRSYEVPADTLPRGLTRVMQSNESLPSAYRGAPLFTDAGQVAALLLEPTAGTAVPITELNESIKRLTQGQRELDPFTRLGIATHYAYVRPQPGHAVQFAVVVTQVSAASSAHTAGLKVGDSIVGINKNDLSWETPVAALLSSSAAVEFRVLRQGQELSISVSLP